ncbi:flavin reductase family protein [Amphritea sp. HPY]|uniref:flavin reductase family protein n=1 Tax=Amphritea sp. HPY TaxID=3421652 RepID=UPI003D7C6776
MDIDFSKLSANKAYFTMTQSILPRPVAWVLSENAIGGYNLAPFSFFSAVCNDPPILMFSVGHKTNGAMKDTYSNIISRNDFVVHLAHSGQAQQVTQTAQELPENESEVEHAGLSLVPFNNSPLPRIDGARIAMHCELYDVKEIGNTPQFLIFGRIKNLFIDDDAVELDLKGRIKIAADKIDPITRLGGSDYMTFGDIISISRR